LGVDRAAGTTEVYAARSSATLAFDRALGDE
jgi:hypothetical protein